MFCKKGVLKNFSKLTGKHLEDSTNDAIENLRVIKCEFRFKSYTIKSYIKHKSYTRTQSLILYEMLTFQKSIKIDFS